MAGAKFASLAGARPLAASGARPAGSADPAPYPERKGTLHTGGCPSAKS